MSLLNVSEDFNSHSPRPRERRSVEIGNRMRRNAPTLGSPRKSPRKSPRRSPRSSPRSMNTRNRNQKSKGNSDNNNNRRDGIRPKRRVQESDMSMPIMFEVDDEESSRSTIRDVQSSSYHTPRSNASSGDRSRSRSRNGSSDMSSGPDVVGGEFSEDVFQFDDSIPGSREFQQGKILGSGEFQLDNVPETPEHRVKAMLNPGVHRSSDGPSSSTIPSLSLNDPSENEEAEDEIDDDASEEVEASEESDYEEASEEEDEESDESDEDDDEEDSDDEEDDEESDEEEDEESESSEEESSEESSEESEITDNGSGSVLPASMSTNENFSPGFSTPPTQMQQKIQMRDTGMPPEALQLGRPPQDEFENSHKPDVNPAQSRQRTRGHDRVREPQNTFSLELDAPPSQTTQRTRRQDRAPPTQDNSLQLDAPPTRQRQRTRSHDSHDSIDDSNNSLQLDAPPTRQRQRTRSNESSDSFSNSLELDAPPTRQRQRVKSNESSDSFSNSLELDAPPTRQRQRTRSNESSDSFSNSLELDAPATRPRQRVKSNESNDSFANSLELDAPPTRQRQRMKSHESEETDEDEAADTISDLPMPAPRTRTRTRQKQSKPDRMMSFEPFQIGNLSNTLQVDVAPPQPQVGRIRRKARDRIMSVGPGMHDLPQDAAPKVRMPPERRLSLDSRRHVYEEEGNTTPFGQRRSSGGHAASSSATASGDSQVKKPTPLKKNNSYDELEASPGAKNRRRLRSADDLEEIRLTSVEPAEAASRAAARRNMFKRRISGGRADSPRREKASYLLGMHKGSVLQGRELESSMRSPPGIRGPMVSRQPRQRPAPNRFKPLKPPPSNDSLDIDDMAAIRRFSENLSKRHSVESDDTIGDGSADTMERGEARPRRQRHNKQNSQRSTEMDQKDQSELDEKQFWLIVTFLTGLGVIFGFVAVKVS